MFRLTREVRFAINTPPDDQLSHKPTNSFGGYPSLRGFGRHYSLAISLSGPLDVASSYLINIKQVDAAVRERAIPLIAAAVLSERPKTPEAVLLDVLDLFKTQWPSLELNGVCLSLSPTLSLAAFAREPHMVRLSQKFEFSATHRLHNPALTAAENVETFGKCNNPHGHGHNYELQVTLAGAPGNNGVLIDLPQFERTVALNVIDRFDHRNLNLELPEFAELNPTVENIARVIYGLLRPHFAEPPARLHSVTVWETPKTWCEYQE